MAKQTDQEWAEMLLDAFEFSYTEQIDDIKRLISLQDTYDNKVDDSMWPTQSRIPLPLAWAAAETATGPAMEYLFPPMPSLRMIPVDEMDPDTLSKVTWSLYLMLINRMSIKRECTRSVKDCFKVGVGYGIVEPITVTPPAVFDVVAGKNETKQMRMGRPVRSLRYRYISPGKILPYPSGVDFNGTDATPYAFFLDLYPEDQFRNLFDKDRREGEEITLKGGIDVGAIIDEARSRGFSSQTNFTEFTDKMSGRKTYAKGNQSNGKPTVPIMVPVLKCYADKRHTWLFCGADITILFDKQNTFDTMRKPLIKFDAWSDSDRWFSMSQPEADERTTWAKNILFNAVNDLVTQSVNRPLLYDTSVTDEPPEFGPDGVVGLEGDVNKTATFMQAPSLDAGIFTHSAEIDKTHDKITGQSDFTDKNFTRGGSQAFEALLSTSTGRDRLRYALLETGGFESIIRQTLIYMQTMGSGMDLNFQRPAYSVTKGEEYIEYFSVTEDDMKHAFALLLDLGAKQRLGAADINTRIALYNLKQDNPMIDQWAASEDLFTDPYVMERQRLPREVALKKQEALEAAKLEETRAAAPTGATAGPQPPLGVSQGGAV